MNRLIARAFVILSLVLTLPVNASHENEEPSDGTVGSFIEITPPKAVSVVRFQAGDDQQDVRLDDYKGKLVLLNLWATWCPPCLRELPALDRLQKRLGGDDFVVLPVALDRKGYDAVKEYYEKLNIKHMDIYVGDTDEFASAFPVDVFPASFFIDKDGKVLSFLRSYVEWDDPRADKKIRDYIAQSTGR